jgi:hypothetical protein
VSETDATGEVGADAHAAQEALRRGTGNDVEVTREMIERRAFEIYISAGGGSPEDHWEQAERELRDGG